MVKFLQIKIESFKAIESLTLDLTPGIIKVVGVNNDDPYDSNGSGKTTAVQALSFALFNKDFNGAPIGSLGNRAIGKPPIVSVSFLNTTTGKMYLVENNKQTKVHSITEVTGDGLGKPLVGAADVQREIVSVIGMTYTTFKLTHYITSATINSIAENLSQPAVFNDLLQVLEYQKLEKDIAEVSREVQKELTTLELKLDELLRGKELSQLKEKFNMANLKQDEENLTEELKSLELNYSKIADDVQPQIKALEATVAATNKEIYSINKALHEGVCSTCGTTLTDEGTLKSLEATLEELKVNVAGQAQKLESLQSSFKAVTFKYTTSRAEIQEALSKVTSELRVAEEVMLITEGSINVDLEEIPVLEAKIKDLKTTLVFYSTARKEIKSGNIIAGLLNSFFSVVKSRILEYSSILNLGAFSINLSSNNLGMQIQLTQQIKGKTVEVPIETLSNGEKTRLSLLILISMLDSMKVVSDCETNYLVFDEASSSFDKSGVEELSMLFSHLKGLGQSCFLITHGTEMDKVNFDYELTMTKTLGKSTGVMVAV